MTASARANRRPAGRRGHARHDEPEPLAPGRLVDCRSVRRRARRPRTIRSSSTSASARRRSRRSSCGRGWSRSAPDVRVVGLEIDPVRVADAQSAAAPPGLTFRRGGFELAGLRPTVVRAFNVLRQYDESAVTAAWASMTDALAPGGFLVEGTCDERGRLASWILLDSSGPVSLTLAARLANLDRPATLAERLPKALIHHNVAGQPVHDFVTALDDAWQAAAAYASFGARQRWIEAVGRLRADWPILDRSHRWRRGEVTVAWSAVAPGPPSPRPARSPVRRRSSIAPRARARS